MALQPPTAISLLSICMSSAVQASTNGGLRMCFFMSLCMLGGRTQGGRMNIARSISTPTTPRGMLPVGRRGSAAALRRVLGPMLLILMGILGQMQSASGQGLPEACYRLAVARPGLQPIPGVSWSAIERLEGEVVALLASQNSSAEIDQRLTEAREQDSLVFDAALARVVVSVRRSGTAIAAKAGDQYWRVHGVARAILAASDLEGDYSRRHL